MPTTAEPIVHRRPEPGSDVYPCCGRPAYQHDGDSYSVFSENVTCPGRPPLESDPPSSRDRVRAIIVRAVAAADKGSPAGAIDEATAAVYAEIGRALLRLEPPASAIHVAPVNAEVRTGFDRLRQGHTPEPPFTVGSFMAGDGPLTVRSAVFQAIGAASVCWDPTPTGLFDSTRAQEIGDALMEVIEGGAL